MVTGAEGHLGPFTERCPGSTPAKPQAKLLEDGELKAGEVDESKVQLHPARTVCWPISVRPVGPALP